MPQPHFLKGAAIGLAALGLSACVGAYTGPVEVTTFAAAEPALLGQGTIALQFSPELKSEAAIEAFRGAMSDELSLAGYTVLDNEDIADQIARVDTSRTPVAVAGSGNPVNVGVGGSTGTFGSGVGVGLGINLGGGGNNKPRVISELSVAISENSTDTNARNLWEARAQFTTGIDSSFAPMAVNARTLAAAVFEGFPAGDGETISLDADDLVQPE